jgi:poly(3-hydroxybutyrate) depolymerase
VGLDYSNRRFYLSLEDRQLKKEVRSVRSLLASLTGCLNIDQKSIFLSGYSQGGYAATKGGRADAGRARTDRVHWAARRVIMRRDASTRTT